MKTKMTFTLVEGSTKREHAATFDDLTDDARRSVLSQLEYPSPQFIKIDMGDGCPVYLNPRHILDVVVERL